MEGLGHCAACHSPRNFMGARTTPAYGGGSAEGWYAPPLSKDNLSQQPWTKIEFVIYLMDGWHANHGMAAGPMTPVVDALHKQNEIDVFAIATYVGTLRAGEKPIDEAAARAAALKLEWGHPEAPPVPKEFATELKYSRRAACNAIATTAPRFPGTAKLGSRARGRQCHGSDQERHQTSDRRTWPIHAGVGFQCPMRR